jgi:hypothetical protein
MMLARTPTRWTRRQARCLRLALGPVGRLDAGQGIEGAPHDRAERTTKPAVTSGAGRA